MYSIFYLLWPDLTSMDEVFLIQIYRLVALSYVIVSIGVWNTNKKQIS